MIADCEGVDTRPQAPARPFSHLGMHGARDDEDDEIACLREYDGKAAFVRFVGQPAEEEDDA